MILQNSQLDTARPSTPSNHIFESSWPLIGDLDLGLARPLSEATAIIIAAYPDMAFNKNIVIGVAIFLGIIILIIGYCCWKGEKVGRTFHMPFRDTRRSRKARAVQGQLEGEYSSRASTIYHTGRPELAAGRDVEMGRMGHVDDTPPTEPPPAYTR